MKFDALQTAKCNVFSACAGAGGGPDGGTGNNPLCADPNYRATHPGECPDDPRCVDPIFAAANPMLCLLQPRLIIKPSAAVVEVLEDVQFKAFLVLNGQETELTEGVTYTSGSNVIALVGGSSGNATGVAPGITSVIATYAGMTATAQIEVIAEGECSIRINHFLMLFDVSKSSLVPFGGLFSTRLNAAESIAESFVTGTDTEVHDFAVMKFSTSATEVLPFTNDREEIVDAIRSMSSSQGGTNLSAALTTARAYFDAQGVEARGRVLMLFTDGENNEGVDPLPIADEIRESGIILIVVGLRAKYTPFRMLANMASGGFFVNVIGTNAALAAEYVLGMRQYLCSSNCTPEGDITIGVGQLNYTEWTNWDVIDGEVDLIGKNDGGPPFFDLVPGNGLYMDDHGSGPDFAGTVTSKTAFTLVNGQQYRLTVRIAGHNRTDPTSRNTLVQFGSYVNETVTRTAAEAFSNEVWDFTATGVGPHKILIAGQETAGSDSFGNLIGSVKIENITTSTVMLEDNFDTENPQYQPPGCGSVYNGAEYFYGYNCYNACLDAPIPAQIPDPIPLPNVEGELPATEFTGVAEAESCCVDDLTNCEKRVATAVSDISQADADLKAYAVAKSLADVALVC